MPESSCARVLMLSKIRSYSLRKRRFSGSRTEKSPAPIRCVARRIFIMGLRTVSFLVTADIVVNSRHRNRNVPSPRTNFMVSFSVVSRYAVSRWYTVKV